MSRLGSITKAGFVEEVSLRYAVSWEENIEIIAGNQTPIQDLEVLYGCVRTLKPKTILEIGTFLGHTTLGLSVNSPSTTVYTVDICDEMRISVPEYQRFEVLPKWLVGLAYKTHGRKIIQILGDSRDAQTYAPLGEQTAEFAFVDGNHSREAVIQDSLNVLKHVCERGIVFWHDVREEEHIGVKKALEQIQDLQNLSITQIEGTWLAYTILGNGR
jgi:hypothetical protein